MRSSSTTGNWKSHHMTSNVLVQCKYHPQDNTLYNHPQFIICYSTMPLPNHPLCHYNQIVRMYLKRYIFQIVKKFYILLNLGNHDNKKQLFFEKHIFKILMYLN